MIIDAYILMKWVKFYKMLFKSSDKSRIKSIILKVESRVDLNLKILFNESSLSIFIPLLTLDCILLMLL